MLQTDKDDPLIEWNRLNKENAEHGFVTSLYQSLAETSPLLDKFSIWLLAGTGATAALMITQIESILPFLTEKGFKACLVVLVFSSISGFFAKYFALRCEIQTKVQSKLSELVGPILDKHSDDKRKISDFAKKRGIEIQADLDFSNIINEFSRPFPRWIRWLIVRKTEKTSGDRQAGSHVAIKAYMSQTRWTFFQAVLFISFVLSAVLFAKAI